MSEQPDGWEMRLLAHDEKYVTEILSKPLPGEPIRGEIVREIPSVLGIAFEGSVIDIGSPADPVPLPDWLAKRDALDERVDAVLDKVGVDQASTIVDVHAPDRVTLYGDFTPAQLRAIADVMDALAKE